MVDLVHELLLQHDDNPGPALRHRGSDWSYADLAAAVAGAANGLAGLGLERDARVAVYLEKRPEAVIAMFGAAAAGGVFVPVNPLLKPPQVAHVLSDSGASVLVTSAARLAQLTDRIDECPGLRAIVVVDGPADTDRRGIEQCPWEALGTTASGRWHRRIDADMAAILYTSGSTGPPKGVVLSHRNLVAGARSVCTYLGNHAGDRLLALLPLSFDYGLSQVTTAFASGGCAVLADYLVPGDVVRTVAAEGVTGLAAVPPLWIQLAETQWPPDVHEHLRYITNSGGALPRATVAALRRELPRTRVILMYGLTEAFRSTYLPPEELDRRPDSVGRAVPNADIRVLRPDGSPCEPDEPGELVHRGALVAMGYWNRPEATAERFRPLPSPGAVTIPEHAVWSGDTVRMDADGFVYFLGRDDNMIKTSGYRVSPEEIEDAVHASGLVEEAAAVGVPHPVLGEAIIVIVTGNSEPDALLSACRRRLPNFMLPARVMHHDGPLPRNANGKLDRTALEAYAGEPFTPEQ